MTAFKPVRCTVGATLLVLLLAVNAWAAIVLLSFEASVEGQAIHITWETASEVDTLGFYIQRSVQEAGGYERISDLVLAVGDVVGASYGITDTNVAAGLTYYYRLEAITLGGASEFYDPVSASLPPPTALPTDTPTVTPTPSPVPSATPTNTPTALPTVATDLPTAEPTATPTDTPTAFPTVATPMPAETPTTLPTVATRAPSATHTPAPTATPTAPIAPITASPIPSPSPTLTETLAPSQTPDVMSSPTSSSSPTAAPGSAQTIHRVPIWLILLCGLLALGLVLAVGLVGGILWWRAWRAR